MEEFTDYANGGFNFDSMSPPGAARDFLSSGYSLMGLGLLSDPSFETAFNLPPHLLDLGCEGDLRREPDYYLLRGGEIESDSEPACSTHIPLSLVLN